MSIHVLEHGKPFVWKNIQIYKTQPLKWYMYIHVNIKGKCGGI